MIDYEKMRSDILASENVDQLSDSQKPPVPKCADNQNYIFISYSHKDYRSVYCDLLELHRAGVRYWYDSGLPAGEYWDKAVEKKLQGANCAGVIFYLSENFILSASIMKELRLVLGECGDEAKKNYFAISLSDELPEDLIWQTLGSKKKSELKLLGIEDVREHEDFLNRVFPNAKTNIIKTSEDSTHHITRVVEAAERQFNISASEAIEENEDMKKLREQLDFAKKFAIRDGVLCSYIGTDTEVIIPDGVTEIGNGAFRNREDIVSVIIPEGVTVIHDEAFMGCRELKHVVIPEGVVSICDKAFWCCYNLENIYIPDSIRHMGRMCFDWKYSRSKKDLYIGKWFVSSWLIRENVIIKPGTVGIIGGAFEKTPVKHVELPDGLIYIENEVFKGCDNLVELKIPDSVKYIGENAFADCVSLERITVPNGIEHIGIHAFGECKKIQELVIPGTAKSIEAGVFYGCRSLEKVVMEEGIENIGYSSFSHCESLSILVLPKSIKRIAEDTFFYCKSLGEIHYNGTMSEWADISGYYDIDSMGEYLSIGYTIHCVDGDINNQYIFDSEISNAVKKYIGTDVNVCVPSCIGWILDEAFKGREDIISIQLPEKMYVIDSEAFCGCKSLVQINIPEKVTEIGENAFKDTGIRFEIDGGGYYLDNWLIECHAEGKSFEVRKGTRGIALGAFNTSPEIEHVIILEEIAYLNLGVFDSCENLKSLTIPKGENDRFEEGILDFFNGLEDLYYLGTLADWEAMEKDDEWLYREIKVNIHCIDGDVPKNN